jgi:hypothetical protein
VWILTPLAIPADVVLMAVNAVEVAWFWFGPI